jgi:hypothetical protein
MTYYIEIHLLYEDHSRVEPNKPHKFALSHKLGSEFLISLPSSPSGYHNLQCHLGENPPFQVFSTTIRWQIIAGDSVPNGGP